MHGGGCRLWAVHRGFNISMQWSPKSGDDCLFVCCLLQRSSLVSFAVSCLAAGCSSHYEAAGGVHAPDQKEVCQLVLLA